VKFDTLVLGREAGPFVRTHEHAWVHGHHSVRRPGEASSMRSKEATRNVATDAAHAAKRRDLMTWPAAH
jgi:hypothetical protein